MSQGTPNPLALVLAVVVDSVQEGLIAAMDMVTSGVNRVVRWLDKGLTR